MNRYILGLAIAAAAVAAAGCTASFNSNTNAVNNTSANANSPANTAAAAATPPATSGVHPAGSLATPTAAYLTAYDYRQKKDIEGLKKVMSKDILDFFNEIGKEENKSADDMLRELCEDPQASTAESRNEKIDGDHATVEYLDAKGGWQTMDFEKVGSEWKLTFPKGEKPTAGTGKDPKSAANK